MTAFLKKGFLAGTPGILTVSVMRESCYPTLSAFFLEKPRKGGGTEVYSKML
jgi:hypothetical protein